MFVSGCDIKPLAWSSIQINIRNNRNKDYTNDLEQEIDAPAREISYT